MDKKLRTSSTSIWPMMLLLGSTGKSHHWTVGLVVDLGEDMVSRKKLMIFWRGKNDRGVKFSLHLSKYTHNFAR